MKRVILLLLTNAAVMLMLSVIVNLLGLNRYLTANGLDLTMLLVASAVIGFGGAFISLMMSKAMAKWTMGLHLIKEPANETERWLVQTVHGLADKARIAHPEVAIYEGAPNAFATGPGRNNSLVAVSTGLLQSMNREQVTAVLGHEVAHIDNGDMVTLTLVQGVLNTFVYFLATIVGHLVDMFLRSRSENSSGGGIGFFLTQMVAQIVFGLLASLVVAYVSRRREFKADAGSARLNSAGAMISALENLANGTPGQLPKSMAAFGIAESGLASLFATHPSMQSRIEALRGYK